LFEQKTLLQSKSKNWLLCFFSGRIEERYRPRTKRTEVSLTKTKSNSHTDWYRAHWTRSSIDHCRLQVKNFFLFVIWNIKTICMFMTTCFSVLIV
jgi:hypothetical protein